MCPPSEQKSIHERIAEHFGQLDRSVYPGDVSDDLMKEAEEMDLAIGSSLFRS